MGNVQIFSNHFSAEPYASMTDILIASQYLEKAIHAQDLVIAHQNINLAIEYLGYASDYLHKAKLYNEQAKVLSVISCYHKLLTLSNNIPLLTFQTQYLYNSMADMSKLYQMVVGLMATGAGPITPNICSTILTTPNMCDTITTTSHVTNNAAVPISNKTISSAGSTTNTYGYTPVSVSNETIPSTGSTTNMYGYTPVSVSNTYHPAGY